MGAGGCYTFLKGEVNDFAPRTNKGVKETCFIKEPEGDRNPFDYYEHHDKSYCV